MPLTMIHKPTPIDATSIRYWSGAAAAIFTVMTEQANPAMRTPNTATIELAIEKLRLWRVVRGAPRNAKVRAANANG